MRREYQYRSGALSYSTVGAVCFATVCVALAGLGIALGYNVSTNAKLSDLETRISALNASQSIQNDDFEQQLQLQNQQIVDQMIALISLNVTQNITELTEQVNELELQMIQKCVELIALQTQTNQTGAGVNVATLPTTVSVSNLQQVPFSTELWDDADFWSPANSTRIFIPFDGRYAIGIQFQHTSTVLNNRATAIEVFLNNGATSASVCIFFTAIFDQTSQVSLYGYCERELLKDDLNYLTAVLRTYDVAGVTPNVNLKLSVRNIGTITGTGISPP